MSPLTCSRLDEVRRALAAGHWPQACSPDLRAHADACARCAQEVLLTTHFQQSRAEAIAAPAPSVSPSLLWWRAQNRRRHAALQRAGRPLAAAQVFAFLIVAATLIGLVATHWQRLLALTPQAPSVSTLLTDWGLAPILLALTLVTTLTGVVLYLTTERH